ncbi:substrate-binding periplasmic protein [Halofilum ochraceum]|uniref:substrate-binding periplasmic protein n=1 Tax=Halofilum ochraceum TaxID=1611323 RepID=UPI0009F47A8C|nr:transporter substrate-binding domain-containing protein [Halofilum ochraceum]
MMLKQNRAAMLGLIVGGLLLVAATGVHARQVTMCTLNWEPYYGEELPREGFFTDIVRTAFERGGHSAQTEFMPWARAMLEVKQGDRDVLLGAYYNEERAETYIASDPIFTDEVGIVAHEDLGLTEFDSLRELSDYTIGYGRGYSVSEEFDSAEYLDKEPEESQVLNLRKLFAGRIDLIAGSFASIRYVANREGHDVDELVFLEPTLKENTLHIMISRAIDDGDELMADFHDGLSEIRSDGTYDRILEEMGYK